MTKRIDEYSTATPADADEVLAIDVSDITDAAAGTLKRMTISSILARVTSLAASVITSGTVATARLGSGSASSSTYLRGDQTWASVSASGAQTYGTTTARNAATPSTGDVWFDSTLSKTGFWDGTIWRDITTWFQLGAIATDTFTAANGTIVGHVTDTGSKTWASVNGFNGTITSNQFVGNASGINGLDVGQSTYAIQFTAVNVPSGAGMYIRHGGTNTANGISLKNDSGTWKWYKDNSLVQTSGLAYSAGQTVKIAVVAGAHTVTIGGSSDTYNDSTYTGVTFICSYVNITIDDLVITAS